MRSGDGPENGARVARTACHARRVLFRKGLAVLSLGAGGVGVASLDWWSLAIVGPAIALAFVIDPD